MIFAFLAGLPWWLSVALYIAIGLVWSMFYWPRQIRKIHQRYLNFRESYTGGEALKAYIEDLQREPKKRQKSDHPADIFASRSEEYLWVAKRNFDCSFSSMVRLFCTYAGFWPLSILIFLISDFLIPFFRNFFKMIDRVATFIREKIAKPIARWILRWVYRFFERVSAVYRVIINYSNREAINDLKIINAKKGASHD